jgi:hypothetical protein
MRIILTMLALFGSVACMLLAISACGQSDRQKDNKILAAYQKQEQAAHLTNNAPLLLEMMSDTVTQVKGGAVKKFVKSQLLERFTQYFGMVEFIKWEDTAPPVYYLSDDGSTASVIVQRRVELRMKNDTTNTIEKTDFAWTELWRKEKGQWRMHTNISTDRKGE